MIQHPNKNSKLSNIYILVRKRIVFLETKKKKSVLDYFLFLKSNPKTTINGTNKTNDM